MVEFNDFSKEILDLSYDWLNDPEIKYLTQTPDFTKEDQLRWFNNLPENESYYVKAIYFNSIPIGVVGLKKIDLENKTAEYYGYIGDKSLWGKGLSKEIFNFITEIAKNKFDLNTIYLNVVEDNHRAIRAYEKAGFKITNNLENNIKMLLIL